MNDVTNNPKVAVVPKVNQQKEQFTQTENEIGKAVETQAS